MSRTTKKNRNRFQTRRFRLERLDERRVFAGLIDGFDGFIDAPVLEDRLDVEEAVEVGHVITDVNSAADLDTPIENPDGLTDLPNGVEGPMTNEGNQSVFNGDDDYDLDDPSTDTENDPQTVTIFGLTVEVTPAGAAFFETLGLLDDEEACSFHQLCDDGDTADDTGNDGGDYDDDYEDDSTEEGDDDESLWEKFKKWWKEEDDRDDDDGDAESEDNDTRPDIDTGGSDEGAVLSRDGHLPTLEELDASIDDDIVNPGEGEHGEQGGGPIAWVLESDGGLGGRDADSTDGGFSQLKELDLWVDPMDDIAMQLHLNTGASTQATAAHGIGFTAAVDEAFADYGRAAARRR